MAASTRQRLFLTDELEQRPAGDPELTFVAFMCSYAGRVLRGGLPGPHTEAARATTREPAWSH